MDRFDQFRSVANQPMGTARESIVDSSRHRKYLAPCSIACRSEMTFRLGRGFDHDHPQRQSADNPIALRKGTLASGGLCGGASLTARERSSHFGGQRLVFGRIDIEAHRCPSTATVRPPAARVRPWRCRVDPPREPADDGQSVRGPCCRPIAQPGSAHSAWRAASRRWPWRNASSGKQLAAYE